MTLQELQEELKPFLKEDVIQDEATWKKITEDVQSVVNDGTKSVLKNKEEILAEKKTLQEKFKELEGQIESAKPFIENEVSFAEYERVKSEYEAFLEKREQEPDVAKLKAEYYDQGKRTATQELQPKLTEFEKQVKNYQDTLKEMQTKYKDTLKRNELGRAINELGIKADDYWMKGFYASADAEYIEAEDRISISLPHPSDSTIGNLPLNDWVRIFPQTEQGQKMIIVPRNSGAGARGSDGSPGGNKNLKQTIDGMFQK